MVINVEIKNLPQIKAGFRQAPALMNKNLNIAIRKSIFYIEGNMLRNIPVRTGRLRGSAYTSFSPLKGEVGTKAKYGLFVHEGTSAYTIYPTSKKALYWKGAAYPVRRVNHPGIKANPYLQRAIDQSQSEIDRFFQEAVDETLNKVAGSGG